MFTLGFKTGFATAQHKQLEYIKSVYSYCVHSNASKKIALLCVAAARLADFFRERSSRIRRFRQLLLSYRTHVVFRCHLT